MVGTRGPHPYWTGPGGGAGAFGGTRWNYLGQKIPSFTFVIPMSTFEPSWAPSHAAHQTGRRLIRS
jgi:hypothetical protein